MKKKVLLITRTFVADSPVGVRNSNFVKYLSQVAELEVLNLTPDLYLYKSKSRISNLIFKVLNKLPWLPDIDVLIIKKYKKRIKQLLNEKQFDTILIGILPFSFLLLVKYVRKLRPNINIVVDLTDPITANINFKKYNYLKQHYLEYIEKSYFPMIDTLIVLNPELKSYYENKYLMKNIVVIEQGIEKSITVQTKRPPQNNRLEFSYIGALYKKGREPFELYKAIEQMEGEIRLNMYGGFKKKFIPPDTDCFYYGGRVSREKVKEIYNETDVVVFIDNQHSLQVPGKTLEVMALNKPVLFIYYNDDSPTINQIKVINDFVYFAKNNRDEIANGINSILNIEPTKLFGISRNITQFYWENILIKLIPHL